jgi:hypothetical protein
VPEQEAAKRQALLQASRYFEQQSAGYATWGKVEVLQIALRLDAKRYLLTDSAQTPATLTDSDIQVNSGTDDLFGQILAKRSKVQVILVTRQQYASQVREEIPPILDDQAQLLGVTVRVVQDEKKIVPALNGRYATILGYGSSLCLGSSLEDAYVAAQLLEKTSKAFIEAKVLGGAKPINKIEAWLMQQFYLLKYSKAAEKNR